MNINLVKPKQVESTTIGIYIYSNISRYWVQNVIISINVNQYHFDLCVYILFDITLSAFSKLIFLFSSTFYFLKEIFLIYKVIVSISVAVLIILWKKNNSLSFTLFQQELLYIMSMEIVIFSNTISCWYLLVFTIICYKIMDKSKFLL